MQRLSTDRSIAPLVTQYVPLKIDTGTADWQTWARKYSYDGGSIPIIFVIRADGEKLYAKSGAPAGEQLAQFLLAFLHQSGRSFSDAQSVSLKEAVEAATKAHADGDSGAALRSLAPLKKIGPLGNLGSYAQPALQADELVKAISETGQQQLDKIDSQLSGDLEQPLEAMLQFVQLRRELALLPALKKPLTSAAREYGKRADLREVLDEAETLDRALVMADSPRSKDRGLAALERIVRTAPQSPAAEIALRRLREIEGPDYQPGKPRSSTETTAPSELAKPREWTDASGQFTIVARFVAVQQDQVVLEKEDGSRITVPLDQLSAADQRLLRDR